jgi:hypothetical protein
MNFRAQMYNNPDEYLAPSACGSVIKRGILMRLPFDGSLPNYDI